jgi:hypothetical protein
MTKSAIDVMLASLTIRMSPASFQTLRIYSVCLAVIATADLHPGSQHGKLSHSLSSLCESHYQN